MEKPKLVDFLERLEVVDPEAAAVFKDLKAIRDHVGRGAFELMVKIISSEGMVVDGEADNFVQKIQVYLRRKDSPLGQE